MKNIPTWAAGVAFAAVMAMSAHAQLVTNGGFETGDFTGWTVSPNQEDPWVVTSNQGGHTPSGSFYASTGCVGALCIGSDGLDSTNYLYQDLPTVAGQTYQISFSFASGGPGGEGSPDCGENCVLGIHSNLDTVTQELVATFGNTTLVDLVNLSASPAMSQYVFTATATGTTTRLEFQNREDPDYSALDDISVAATPEPGTILMGLSASLIFLGARRFRKA